MNKLIKILLVLSLIFSLPIQAKNLCQKQQKLLFGYFNGMNTQYYDAQKALNKFKKTYGTHTPFPLSDEIVYELFYNQTKGKIKDAMEIYEQRFIEQNPELFAGRYEFIHEVQEGGGDMTKALKEYEEKVLKPKYGAKYQQKLQELDKQTQEIAKDMAIAKMLDDQGVFFEPNYANYGEYKQHRQQIDNHLQQDNKLLFIGYSQGNLFASAAYDYTLPKVQHHKQLDVVHIAPASQTLKSKHVLSSKDIMIKWLLNKFKEVIRVTDINSFNIANIMGHALIETYLDPKQPTSKHIDQLIKTAFSELIVLNNQQNKAFFTLEFDYKGKNMNFTLTEPNGDKLYQDNQQSKNGYLSVNKTAQGGTIQYLASCEDNQLQAGSYKIQIKEPIKLQREHALLKTNSHLNEIDLVHLNDHSAIKQNGVNIWNYAIKVNFDALSNKYSYNTNFTQNSKNKVRGLTK